MKEIKCVDAPSAIGPYSQATKADCGKMIFVSGQLPIDSKSGNFAGDEIKAQTEQSLKNVSVILKEAGATMANVVKATVFLQNMEDFAGMNEVYSQFFQAPYPARAAFAVKTLPKNALVEIEVIAMI